MGLEGTLTSHIERVDESQTSSIWLVRGPSKPTQHKNGSKPTQHENGSKPTQHENGSKPTQHENGSKPT